MANVLEQIIDKSQTAYVPGRAVADNLRSNFYFKSYCTNNKINSILVSLDAKKAFDSVDHIYIEKTLAAYGFGPNFIKVFKTLYNKITSRIMINGYLSEKINIERGVKQGDALSCALFIICIDPLLRNLNKNNLIKAINIKDKISKKDKKIKFKAAAYADDISIICKNDPQSIQEIFNEYNRLTNKSGLELNADKTEILIINEGNHEKLSFIYQGIAFKIDPVNNIKICGLHFSNDRESEYNSNVINKINKLNNQIRKWSHQYLTFEGKNLIIKTFGLSQIIYNMQVYEYKDNEIRNVEKIIFQFLWSTKNNKKGIDRIKRTIMKNDYEMGGIKVTDVECLNKALKTRQFIRASKSNHPISKIQAFLSSQNDPAIKQEYCEITKDEPICFTAQTTINCITDYNRETYNKEMVLELGNSNLVDEVLSINLESFLKRKNKLFHVCMLRALKRSGIESLGELISEYETEQDVNTNKTMRIILSAFPKNLTQIAENRNEYTACDENLIFTNVGSNKRIELVKVTTSDFQIILKKILKKVEATDFKTKLVINNFDTKTITRFRSNCKNIKLRNTFFRLIHNDFFTYARMKKYRMVEDDKCIRCAEIETSNHLLWECSHVTHIWKIFNSFLLTINKPNLKVEKYEDVFDFGTIASIDIIKIKIINELIQMERPTNWTVETFKGKIREIIQIEKYNCTKNRNLNIYFKKWSETENWLLQ